MKHEIRLSHRAARDLDRLDKPAQKRMVRRLEELAQDPYNPRLSAPLSGQGGLRKSRVGAWRIIYQAHESRNVRRRSRRSDVFAR